MCYIRSASCASCAESEKLGIIHLTRTYRSSRPEVFCKKGDACKSIKKETLAQIFSCEFCEISKNTFFYRPHLVAVYHIKKLTNIFAIPQGPTFSTLSNIYDGKF